jgi:hypothetical protein
MNPMSDAYAEPQYASGTDFREGIASHVPHWLKHVIWAAIIIIPAIIGATVRSDRIGVCFLAYLNCLLYALFGIHFLKKGTLGNLIPLLAPSYLIIGSCVGLIYFGVFIPDAMYETLGGNVSYFAGGVRYQLAIFGFLLVYFLIMLRLLRSEDGVPQSPAMCTKYIAYLTLAIYVPVMLIGIVDRVASLGPIGIWGNRLLGYYLSLLFVVGALFGKMSKSSKIFLIVFLGGTIVFFTLGVARGFAMKPVFPVVCGILLFSEVKNRTKLIFMAVTVVLLPLYMMVGNTIRLLTHTGAGAYRDFSQHLEVLKDWRQATQKRSPGVNFFGRMFLTAGNVIVADSPSRVPYLGFNPVGYFREATIYLLPGPVIEAILHSSVSEGQIGEFFGAKYTGKWRLLDYGIYVSPTQSVETSTIGACWMLGGFPYVIAGGCVLALIHGFTAWRIRRAWIENPDKGLFYFAIFFHSVYWTFNTDLILLWRNIIWMLIFAYFGYRIIFPFLRSFYAGMWEEYYAQTGYTQVVQ